METRESYQYLKSEIMIVKSPIQKTLESQGCVFKGQELLTNHELDITKPCQCGREVKK